MKIFFIAFILSTQLVSFGQYTAVMGKRDNSNYAEGNMAFVREEIRISKYDKVVDGSPYFNNDFVKATIVTSDGRKFGNQLIRLDIFANQVQYLDKDDRIFLIAEPLIKIIFDATVTDKQVVFVNGAALHLKNEKLQNIWFEESAEPYNLIYKQYLKVLTEITPIGSASVQQRIETVEKMFYLKEGELMKVRK